MDVDKIKKYLSNRFDNWLYREFKGYEVNYYGKNIPIPDYKTYKVENCPELTTVKKSLASQGLKDPWLRNHVWRYGPGYGQATHWTVYMKFFRGWKQGLFLALCYSYYVKKTCPEYNTFHHDGLPMSLMHLNDDNKGHH